MSVRHGPDKARTPPTINDGEAKRAKPEESFDQKYGPPTPAGAACAAPLDRLRVAMVEAGVTPQQAVVIDDEKSAKGTLSQWRWPLP
eukprot:15440762-Alexandrium_andersonii.AAC.1